MATLLDSATARMDQAVEADPEKSGGVAASYLEWLSVQKGGRGKLGDLDALWEDRLVTSADAVAATLQEAEGDWRLAATLYALRDLDAIARKVRSTPDRPDADLPSSISACASALPLYRYRSWYLRRCHGAHHHRPWPGP